MATERTKMPSYEDGKTPTRVKAFAAKYGYGDSEAYDFLAQYALNRLAVLAAYEAKKGKPDKTPRKKASKKAKAAA